MKTFILLVSLATSLVLSAQAPAAAHSRILISQGPTPFISFVRLRVSDPTSLSRVAFNIRPKPGSHTRAVAATYSSAYLKRRGYLDLDNGKLIVPVFGLYAGFNNSVTLRFNFSDGSSRSKVVRIATAPFDDGTYTNPTIVQARLSGTTLSYDYILLKNYATKAPIIIDSDAEVRWVGTNGLAGQDSILFDNGFYVGAGSFLYRMEFDGKYRTVADYSSLGVVGFHHNFDYGRDGFIMDVDTTDWTECVNIEVDAFGNVLRTWNLADIISAAMIAGGDDPSLFVHPGTADWFHNNATAYRSSDNSLIVSSRENFVIALDYDTSAIKWILGDPTKHWYEFASLRAFALALGADTLSPIGQHAVSMAEDQLLLFDNGAASVYQYPAGDSRTYSAPRRYSIDTATKMATEIWHYLADPAIDSPFCSSVYEDTPDNYLIDYTLAGPYVSTDIAGLDSTGAVAFYYQYTEVNFCGTGWNAAPIHLENLRFK